MENGYHHLLKWLKESSHFRYFRSQILWHLHTFLFKSTWLQIWTLLWYGFAFDYWFETFDLINWLLFRKLFHHGFSDSALNFFVDYFSNRQQSSKVGPQMSDKQELSIGNPQCSIRGRLLFLIYINDRSLSSSMFYTLFNDDTTVSLAGDLHLFPRTCHRTVP